MLALFTVAARGLRRRHGRVLRRAARRPAQAGADVSPGKTWEGFVAGTVAAILVTFFALYKQDFLSIAGVARARRVIAVAAPLGDLFESALKRDLGVKDSGRLLGGPRRRARPIDASSSPCRSPAYLTLSLALSVHLRRHASQSAYTFER